MSYFSTALTRLAERAGIRQADVVRETHLQRSQVSRLFTGEQKYINEADLTAVLNIFRDPLDRAEIIAARCMDVRMGPGAEFVEITVTKPARAEAAADSRAVAVRKDAERQFPDVELSHETERAFAWLRRQCPLNPDLEQHLVGYAKLTGMK